MARCSRSTWLGLGRRPLLMGGPGPRCLLTSGGGTLSWRPLPGTVLGAYRERVAATRSRVYNYGVRVHNQNRRRMVEDMIGRLPALTESQLGRLEDEIRRERQRRASSAGGEQDSPHQEGTAPPLTEVLEYR